MQARKPAGTLSEVGKSLNSIERRIGLSACVALAGVLIMVAKAADDAANPLPEPPAEEAQKEGVPNARQDWSRCEDCHPNQGKELPPLSLLRPESDGALELDSCTICHKMAELTSPPVDFSHPVRSVGSHIECTMCHQAVAHSAAHPPPMPYGEYDPEGCYSCHRGIDADRSKFSAHADDGAVSCSGCHPAHKPMRAQMPLPILPPRISRDWDRVYDYLASSQGCLQCHAGATLMGSLQGGFSTLNTRNYHYTHVVVGKCLCIECHEPHGAMRQALLRQRVLTGAPFLMLERSNGASCSVSCHGVEHDNWSYTNRLW